MDVKKDIHPTDAQIDRQLVLPPPHNSLCISELP